MSMTSMHLCMICVWLEQKKKYCKVFVLSYSCKAQIVPTCDVIDIYKQNIYQIDQTIAINC